MYLHSSKSECVGELMPDGMERQLRAQLRAMRFCQPLEFAQLEQAEVRKFLSSKSVHSWLSEWELSHAFGGGTMDRRQQQQYWGMISSCSKKSDVAVQCLPDQIDAEMATSSSNHLQGEGANHGPSNLPEGEDDPLRNVWDGVRSYWHRFPPLMDASTNTQTTETTGTGGMNIYRRASYLEEYAMERVREMEEEKLAKEAKERRKEEERKRRRRAKFWRKYLCCCRCGQKGSNNEDAVSSISDAGTSFGANSSTLKKLSSNTADQQSYSVSPRKGWDLDGQQHQQGEASWHQQQRHPIVVKKFTLSRSGGVGGGGTTVEPWNGLQRWRISNGFSYGAMPGNYENVTPPPPPVDEEGRRQK